MAEAAAEDDQRRVEHRHNVRDGASQKDAQFLDDRKRLRPIGRNNDRYQQMLDELRNLAVFGEQIILSVRYGDWIDINDQDFAKTWARYWRPEIQGYIHAYLSATGVDLSEDVVDARRAANRHIQPSTLLRERLARQDSRAELPPATISGTLAAGESDVPAISAPRRRALNPYRRG